MVPGRFVEFKSRPNPKLPQVKDITPQDLHPQRTQVKIIDVRRPDEWVGEYGHIPEAELITLDTLPGKINELPKESTLVFVCRSGARSAQASMFALANGFQSVFNMQGGMIAWTECQYEATKENE